MALVQVKECFLNGESMCLYEPMNFQQYKQLINIESNQYDDLTKGFHVNILDTNLFIPASDGYRFLELPDEFRDYCGEV